MENLVAFIFWAIAIVVIVGFVLVFLSIGFAFGDKTDLYEDNEGNIHPISLVCQLLHQFG